MVRNSLNMLYLLVLLMFVVFINCDLSSTNYCPNVKKSLDLVRKRRHLTFPDGSNIVLTISTVKAFMTHAPSGWNVALEIDVLYPLPNHNFTSAHLRRKLHHRQKREFWDKLRNGIDYHSFNGRACVLRGVCEARQHLAPPGRSLVHDLMRVIFAAPLDEADFVDEIRSSYSELLDYNYCDRSVETIGCPFSPLQFVLLLNRMNE